jgi:PAS domain S-box-containing protein
VVLRLSPSGVCKYASPAVRTVFGYDPEALVGRAILALAHPLVVDVLRQALSSLRDGRAELRTWHVALRRADRRWIVTELGAIPMLDYAGTVTELLCFARARKDLGPDDTGNPDDTSGSILLLRSLVHDLRDPGAVVRTCATALRDVHGESFNDRGTAALDEMIGCYDVMFRRLDDAEVVAKMRGELPAADLVELGPAAESAAADLDSGRPGGGGRVRVEKLPKVRGDRRLLTQLFRDAIEVVAGTATSPSAGLRVSARRGDIWWRISVGADGGARKRRVGEKDAWLVHRAACKRIVECHGGEFFDNTDSTRRARRISFTLPAAT